MRGNPLRRARYRIKRRSIPRACGATDDGIARSIEYDGLSPRMRGNPDEGLANASEHRSIPAHAGQPLQQNRHHQRPGVYPRACGATNLGAFCTTPLGGLSPRMRGNQNQFSYSMLSDGSIPAHAGQPAHLRRTSKPRTVYPRACGATDADAASALDREGLSPAHAGQP